MVVCWSRAAMLFLLQEIMVCVFEIFVGPLEYL